ncbi:MAG: hydroxyethylthiazole kinase [Lachnospiraceae bacterium]|nr:hydroxyethylthiazole kinase [Lachnospiraceae bacterium]
MHCSRLERVSPVVHCITNYVTVNDCANIILAGGGRPVMAHHPGEAAQITAGSRALVLNMGTLHDTDSMLLAGKKSNELGHPVVLDPVGVGGSDLRQQTFRSLAQAVRFTVIRGNVSEIKYLATGAGGISGVDAADADRITGENVSSAAELACSLAERLGCVAVISGSIDIVADARRVCFVQNGHPIMAKITGSGCMSTALIGAFLGACPEEPFEAALAAVAVMGVCGELAFAKTEAQQGGTMTFRTHLIDQVSLLTADKLTRLARITRRKRNE